MKKFLGLLLLAVVVLSACNKETRDLKQVEDEQIQAYIKSNNLTGFVKDSTGYYYQILKQGSGDKLKYPDLIYYLQTLKSLGGSEIKLQGDQTQTIANASFKSDYLGYVSPNGFRESMLRLNKGGSVRTIVPSYLAFGKEGYGSQVAGNTILDATLVVPNAKNIVDLNDSLITKYKATLPLQFTRDSSGVYYSIITPGTGTEAVTINSKIKIGYTGKLFDGTIFDSATTDKPLESFLSGLIGGWQATLPKIKAGGKIRILVPSYRPLGYEVATGPIPGNAPLDFEISLVGVTK